MRFGFVFRVKFKTLQIVITFNYHVDLDKVFHFSRFTDTNVLRESQNRNIFELENSFFNLARCIFFFYVIFINTIFLFSFQASFYTSFYSIF